MNTWFTLSIMSFVMVLARWLRLKYDSSKWQKDYNEPIPVCVVDSSKRWMQLFFVMGFVSLLLGLL